MKEIKLTNSGLVALVDDEDYEYLNQFVWSENTGGYASRRYNGKEILMHREILSILGEKKLITDHENLNKLDNQRNNIRICTKLENNKNIKKRKDKEYSSKYKGVYKVDTDKKTWRAMIVSNNNRIHLGYYFTEIEAAIAYNKAAIKYHAEFANLNIITEDALKELETNKRFDKKSIYKGVTYTKKKHGIRHWDAYIKHNGVNITLSSYETELEAALARDEAERFLLKNKAIYNCPGITTDGLSNKYKEKLKKYVA